MIRTGGFLTLTLLAALGWLHLTPAGNATQTILSGGSPSAISTEIEITGAVPTSLTIENAGEVIDRLLGGASPLVERVEPHRTKLVSGHREMRLAPEGIAIPPGATRILEPGHDHLMLIGLRGELIQGETFPLTLHFARAGEVTVPVRVRRVLDAAGITPFPPVIADNLTISLASAPPAPAGTPVALVDR